jgi:hypothetical protein
MFTKQKHQAALENAPAALTSRQQFLVRSAGAAALASFPMAMWGAERESQQPAQTRKEVHE